MLRVVENYSTVFVYKCSIHIGLVLLAYPLSGEILVLAEMNSLISSVIWNTGGQSRDKLALVNAQTCNSSGLSSRVGRVEL